MNILSIGNSFSQDAERYLHRLAKREGVNIKTVNLLIGGCSLRTHYLNILNDKAAYSFEFNGENTGIKVSISDALSSDDWDVITLQQVSTMSGSYETYTPYIEALAEYVKEFCPHAKLLIHETWAYEDGSEKLQAFNKYDTADDMLAAITEAYKKAADAIKADGIIPSGEAMLAAVKMGIPKIHRDTTHASYGAGRYLLALTWYKYLTGNDITDNDFNELDAPMSDEERATVIKAVNSIF